MKQYRRESARDKMLRQGIERQLGMRWRDRRQVGNKQRGETFIDTHSPNTFGTEGMEIRLSGGNLPGERI